MKGYIINEMVNNILEKIEKHRIENAVQGVIGVKENEVGKIIFEEVTDYALSKYINSNYTVDSPYQELMELHHDIEAIIYKTFKH